MQTMSTMPNTVCATIGAAGEIADLGIILGTLVDVLDHERDRRSGRNLKSRRVVRHHAGEYLDLVGLAALRGKARLAGAAAIEIVLNIGGLERNFRRASVDHATDRGAVALAKGGDPEQMAEGIVGHKVSPAGRLGSPRRGRGQLARCELRRPRGGSCCELEANAIST